MVLFDAPSNQVVDFGSGADGDLTGTPTIGARGTTTTRNYRSINCSSITILGTVILLCQQPASLGAVLGDGGGALVATNAAGAPGSAGHGTRDSGSGFSWGCGGAGGATNGGPGSSAPNDGTVNDGGGGAAYSDATLSLFTEGAGGGGAGNGSRGGASLCVQAPSITWSSISLRGTNGDDSGSFNNGSSGGGGGGMCWLRAYSLSGGTITATGGAGGTGTTQFPGGFGAAGRIRIDSLVDASLGSTSPSVGHTRRLSIVGSGVFSV